MTTMLRSLQWVILFWFTIMPLALPGYRTITEEREELTFHVEMDDGRIFHRHIEPHLQTYLLVRQQQP